MLKDLIDPTLRKRFYLAYAIAVVGIGATTVGFATAGAALPIGVVVAEKVVLYLGGALGFLATANTTPSDAQKGA